MKKFINNKYFILSIVLLLGILIGKQMGTDEQQDENIQELNSTSNENSSTEHIHGENVLDVGSGPGFLARSISDIVGNKGSVLGIDISDFLLDIAITNNRIMNFKIHLLVSP